MADNPVAEVLTQGNLPEPFRSRFVQLLEAGAGSADISGEPLVRPSAAFIDRELNRPREHLRNICRYLGRLQPGSILDIGCGTGGLTVALCATFGAIPIVGVDSVPLTIEAARVRAAGCGVHAQFATVPPGQRLPFDDGAFDLVTCTSVIEFITDAASRQQFARELTRVARRHIVLTTPNPFPRMREQHSGRWFGDFRRTAAFPWASTAREMNRLFAPFERKAVPQRVRDKLRMSSLPAWLAGGVERVMPWQFFVYVSPDEVRSSRTA